MPIFHIVGILILVAIAAPIAMFAAKAGFIRVPAELQDGAWDSGRAWRWAALWAAGLTALGAFGAFVLASDWWEKETYERNGDRLVGTVVLPSVQRAYYNKYGSPACTQWNLSLTTPCR